MLLRPTKAFATDYNVWVGGVRVTSDNAASVTGAAITGSVSYDSSANTLMLNNAGITGYHTDGTYSNSAAIYTTDTVTEFNTNRY
jgi:hypothetical protein